MFSGGIKSEHTRNGLILSSQAPRGHISKFRLGCSFCFLNLAKYYFSVLKFLSYYLVWQNFCYFSGSDKFPDIFLGLPIFASYTWILEVHFFVVYIFKHSIFLDLNLESSPHPGSQEDLSVKIFTNFSQWFGFNYK